MTFQRQLVIAYDDDDMDGGRPVRGRRHSSAKPNESQFSQEIDSLWWFTVAVVYVKVPKNFQNKIEPIRWLTKFRRWCFAICDSKAPLYHFHIRFVPYAMLMCLRARSKFNRISRGTMWLDVGCSLLTSSSGGWHHFQVIFWNLFFDIMRFTQKWAQAYPKEDTRENMTRWCSHNDCLRVRHWICSCVRR